MCIEFSWSSAVGRLLIPCGYIKNWSLCGILEQIYIPSSRDAHYHLRHPPYHLHHLQHFLICYTHHFDEHCCCCPLSHWTNQMPLSCCYCHALHLTSPCLFEVELEEVWCITISQREERFIWVFFLYHELVYFLDTKNIFKLQLTIDFSTLSGFHNTAFCALHWESTLMTEG
jgi:hypothetical protein